MRILLIMLFLFVSASSFAAEVQDDIGILNKTDIQKLQQTKYPFDLTILVTNFTIEGFENYFKNKETVGIGVNPISKITVVTSPTNLEIRGLSKLGNKDFTSAKYVDGILKIANEYEKRLRKEIMHNEMSTYITYSLAIIFVLLFVGFLGLVLNLARKKRKKEFEQEQERKLDKIIKEEFAHSENTSHIDSAKRSVHKSSVNIDKKIIGSQLPKQIVYTATPPLREVTMSPMATLAIGAVGGIGAEITGNILANRFRIEEKKKEEETTTPYISNDITQPFITSNQELTKCILPIEYSINSTSTTSHVDSSNWSTPDNNTISSDSSSFTTSDTSSF